jgi:MoxR-like ATPase
LSAVKVTDSFVELVVRFLNHGRAQEAFLSPRAGRDLVRVSQAVALISGRSHVIPDDLKYCMNAVIGHRVRAIDGLIQSFQFQA